jgi:hypothetical protein
VDSWIDEAFEALGAKKHIDINVIRPEETLPCAGLTFDKSCMFEMYQLGKNAAQRVPA